MTRKHAMISRRRGNVLLYVGIGMIAFTGFTSLGIDLAHVRLVKNELQCAADASARYAAAGLATSVAQAKTNAVTAAGECYADGSSVVVSSTNDVSFGTWSGGTFTVLTGAAQSTANAVQVTTHHTAAGGNAVSLTFAAILGMSSADVTVSSTAKYTPGNPSGLIGLSGITVHNGLTVASYDSSVTTTPTLSTYNSIGSIQSNSVISGAGGDAVHGNVTLGPSGSVSGVTYTGTKTVQGTAITGPTVAMQVVTNPGGISQTPNYQSSGTVSWPGGTYYLTSLTLQDSITINFTGPATIYVNGPVTIHDNDTVKAYNGIPSNLVIYEASGNTFSLHDSDNLFAEVIAPGCDFNVAHDHCNFYGSLIANTVEMHDNCSFYCDQEIAGGTNSITTVK